MQIKMKKQVVTAKGVLIPGQVISVKPEVAKRWISAGIASKTKCTNISDVCA